jgi:hypothetical protein
MRSTDVSIGIQLMTERRQLVIKVVRAISVRVVMLQEAVCQLRALAGPAPGVDLEVQLLAEELRGRVLAASGDLEGAQGVLAAAFEAAASAGLQVSRKGCEEWWRSVWNGERKGWPCKGEGRGGHGTIG